MEVIFTLTRSLLIVSGWRVTALVTSTSYVEPVGTGIGDRLLMGWRPLPG